MVYLGLVHGERRWRNPDLGWLYTWDSLHGEVEMFSRRGYHLGALDPLSGEPRRAAVKGRRIHV